MASLANVEDLRRLTRMTWTDADLDSINARLAAASGSVRDYCGWQINAVTNTVVTLDGPGGHMLALPCLNVTSVTEVKIVTGSVVSTVTDFTPSVTSGLLRRHQGWPGEFSSIQVTYTGGYSPIPDVVVAVVCSVVERGVAVPLGVTQEAVGAVNRRYTHDDAGAFALSKTERDILGNYRIGREP